MDEFDIQTPGDDQDFTLEDILREFGSHKDDGKIHDEPPKAVIKDEPQRELIKDEPVRALVRDVPMTERAAPREEPDLLVWTPCDEPDLQIWTPRKKPEPAQTEQAEVHPPEEQGEEDIRVFQPEDQPPEPFSENWEPEYDQPIGDYTPPEPIIFRPRAPRLGELKHKLMEGPERRYNALSEKGVVKLQIALFFSMLIVVLAVASIVLHRLGLVRENRMRLLVFGELFAMLVSALLCWERLTDGVLGMLRGRFNTDTLLAFSFAACVADGLYCLAEVKVPFCAAFCLEGLMCLWSEYQKRSTELLQMDTLRRATRLDRVAKAPECYGDRPGFLVTEGQPEDFMDTYKRPSAPRKALDRFALAALVISVLVAVTAGVNGGLRAGVRTWSAAILAACPATMLICQSRPAWTLQRRLHRVGAVICGWQGVKAAAGRAVVPLSDEDLLPAGSVKLNGVKNYTKRNPDTVLAYATAVMVRSGSCLAPLFEERLRSHRAQSYEIDEFKSYGNQGMGAIICGEKVLVGSREFLVSMGIRVDPGANVNQAVYIAIGEECVGMFVLAFGKLKGVSAGLAALCGQRRLSPLLASTNFVLNESFIRNKYKADTRRMIFPSAEDRMRLASWQPGESVPCALTTQEGLAGMAFAVAGARSLRTASIAGAAAHIISGLVGLAAVLLLTLSGRVDLMTPANLLLLELIWAVPGLMLSEWIR